MKTFIYILALGILTFAVGSFLPYWWMVVVIAFVLALLFKQGMGKSALITFTTVFIVWLALALFINMGNESILSTRMGELFNIGSIGIMIVSALIGGIASMLGALTGASLAKTINS